MNAKRKGTRNEHRSRVLLEAAGYAVTRAAASLVAWDLIGVGLTHFAPARYSQSILSVTARYETIPCRAAFTIGRTRTIVSAVEAAPGSPIRATAARIAGRAER